MILQKVHAVQAHDTTEDHIEDAVGERHGTLGLGPSARTVFQHVPKGEYDRVVSRDGRAVVLDVTLKREYMILSGGVRRRKDEQRRKRDEIFHIWLQVQSGMP